MERQGAPPLAANFFNAGETPALPATTLPQIDCGIVRQGMAPMEGLAKAAGGLRSVIILIPEFGILFCLETCFSVE